MYANLTWQNYLLDILLLAWLGWAVTIILLVNAFFHFHGPLKIPANDPWAETSGFIRSSGNGEAPDYRTNFNTASPSGLTEKCFWLNALLDWFYNRVDSCPIIVDTWILSLNEQARKLGVSTQQNKHLFVCFLLLFYYFYFCCFSFKTSNFSLKNNFPFHLPGFNKKK